MIILICGQVGSGKSRYAEERLSGLHGQPKIYAAMSPVTDDEMRERVKKHKAMRAGKGFLTVEHERNLSGEKFPAGSSVLIESLTAWTANVMFADDAGDVAGEIWEDFCRLAVNVRDVVIVVDDIFSDGADYDPMTEKYLRTLAELTVRIAGIADEVTEVAAGIPMTYKSAGKE